MSSFLKQKKRASEIHKKKAASRSIKKMYKILHKLDAVAIEMIKSGVIITEDNVVAEAAKYTDIEIGNYEQFILLGKCHQVYEAIMKNKKNEESNNT